MKHFYLSILSLLSFSLTQAQWDISTIRQSRIIDELVLEINSKIVDFEYKGTTKTLDSLNFFQVKDKELRVYGNFLNPMKYRVKYKSETLADKLIGDAETYISNVNSFTTGFAKVNIPAPTGTINKGKQIPPELLNKIAASKKVEITISDPQLVELFLLMQEESLLTQYLYDSSVNDLTSFSKQMEKLKFEETKSEINSQLQKIMDNYFQASDRAEADAAIKSNTAITAKIKDELKDLQIRSLGLKTLFDMLPIDDSKLNQALISIKFNSFSNEIDVFIEQVNRDLSNRYDELKNLFDDLLVKPFSGENIQILKINDLKTGSNKKVVLTVEELDYKKETGAITVKNSQTYEMHFRRYNLFVPVVTTGIFYSTLSFNGFGTSTNAEGELLVTHIDNAAEVNQAMASLTHLNFYLNIEHLRGAFLQLGAGPSKELPLLALGGGIEVLNRINISAGTIWTWQPTLGTLNEFDIVTGTTQIEDDIIYKFDNTPTFYIGISINLTK